jgi:ADP-heptose:LPS heptosyltransferase
MKSIVIEKIRRRIAGIGRTAVHFLGTVIVRPFLGRGITPSAFENLPAQQILYVSLAYRGDLILCLPAIAVLKKRFPNCKIVCWIREYNVTLAKLCPDIDEIITYDTFPSGGLGLLVKLGFLSPHRTFIDEIRARHFNLLVDDSGYGFSALVGVLARIPLRIGRDTQGFGFLYHSETPYNENEHLVEKRLRLLRSLGIESTRPERLQIAIERTPAERTCAKLELARHEKFFTIQPYAGWSAKNWQDEKIAAVVDGFAKETGLTPVFIGGSADRERIDKIRAPIEGRSISAAGLLELGETFALISLARFHFGVDSVGSHMAAAAGVRSVTLYGPTNPRLSAFLSTDNIVVLREIPCSPARDQQYCALDAGRLCPQFVCMESLEAQEVLAILIRHWKGSDQNQIVTL